MDEIWIDCRSAHQGHWVRPLTVCRGLAITPRLQGGDRVLSTDKFVITHVQSGLRLTDGLNRSVAEQLLSVLTALDQDWSLPRNRLLEGLRARLRAWKEQGSARLPRWRMRHVQGEKEITLNNRDIRKKGEGNGQSRIWE